MLVYIIQTSIIDMQSHMPWQPDYETNECNDCKKSFPSSFFQLSSGKHHCRWCGLIYCDECSSNKDMLPATLDLQPEITFYEMIKQYFNLTNNTCPIQTSEQRTCNYCHLILQMQSGNLQTIQGIFDDPDYRSRNISPKLYDHIHRIRNF